MQQLGDQPIGSLRRNAPRQQRILALDAPAGDDIIALFDFFDQPRNIRRIILAISIHRDDDFAGAVVQCGHHCGGLSVITPQMHHPDAGVGRGQPVEHLCRAVSRPIIGEHDLGRLRQFCKRLGQTRIQDRQGIDFVVHRDDNRNIHGSGHPFQEKSQVFEKILYRSRGNASKRLTVFWSFEAQFGGISVPTRSSE